MTAGGGGKVKLTEKKDLLVNAVSTMKSVEADGAVHCLFPDKAGKLL